jgi:hypothetical protein
MWESKMVLKLKFDRDLLGDWREIRGGITRFQRGICKVFELLNENLYGF